MPLNFPTSPAVNQQYTFAGRTWIWNGSAWDSYNPGITAYVSGINGLTGGITLFGGIGISVDTNAKGITVTNTGILSFNGLTGAVTGITQINAGSGLSVSGTTNVTITNIGVTGFNGSTGNVSGVTAVNAGTGISITGTTNPTITNTGVQSFNGTTGAVTGVSTFNGLTGAVTGVTTSVANTFTALQTFNVGITASGATLANIRNVNNLSGRAGITFASGSGVLPNTILLKDGSNDININSGSGTVSIGLGGAAIIGTSSKIKLQTTDGDVTTTYGTIDSGTLTSNRTYTLPDATGTFVLNTNISSSAVTSYNGRVGAVQGVSAAVAGTGISVSGATGSVTITNTGVLSFNGLTGGLTLFGGTGMSVLSGGKGITLVNTGVLSIDGSTGAITNVARTNVTNTFAADQVISSPFAELRIANTILGTTAEYSADNINYYSGANSQTLTFNATNPSNNVTLPNYTTTLAGLAGTQTFTGVNTFSSLANFSAGLSAAGITINGPVVTSGLGRFNAGITASGATFTGNVAMTSTSSYTGLASFAGGITTSGITLNGRITASGLGTFNSGITTSGITLNGNLVASGSGKFNSGVLTDFVAPTTGLGVGGVLYLNADGTGAGGGGAVTYIGDVAGDTNNTFMAVDDSSVEINLYAANGQINSFGPINLNNRCIIRTAQVTSDTNTANQLIFDYNGSSWCGAEFIITAQQGAVGVTSMKTCKILVANTSSTVNHTEYGEVVVGTDFVTFNVSISGGTVSLTMTPSGNSLIINTVVGVKATLFPVALGI